MLTSERSGNSTSTTLPPTPVRRCAGRLVTDCARRALEHFQLVDMLFFVAVITILVSYELMNRTTMTIAHRHMNSGNDQTSAERGWESLQTRQGGSAHAHATTDTTPAPSTDQHSKNTNSMETTMHLPKMEGKAVFISATGFSVDELNGEYRSVPDRDDAFSNNSSVLYHRTGVWRVVRAAKDSKMFKQVLKNGPYLYDAYTTCRVLAAQWPCSDGDWVELKNTRNSQSLKASTEKRFVSLNSETRHI